MTMIIIWWVVSAHKWFKGPKVSHINSNLVIRPRTLLTHSHQVNIEHQMLGRDGIVVDGKERDSGDSSAGSMMKEDRVLDDKRAADLA